MVGRLESTDGDPESLPSVFLGDRILLSPRLSIVPSLALPPGGGPMDRDRFFAFHDWLERHRLPSRMAQVWNFASGRDPLW